MEKIQTTKPVFDMGTSTSEVFKGHSEKAPVKEIYGESAVLFANVIKSKVKPEGVHSLVDIGSAKGELLTEILRLLPEYSFDVTATDTNAAAIKENTTPKKIVADAESLPIENNSIDIAVMRYVLQFNSLDSQGAILEEISRVIKEIGIVQHAGSDNDDPQGWRDKVGQIFSSDKLPQINRSGMFYSSAEEIESLMNKGDLQYEKIQSKRINGLSEAFIERYSLDKGQVELLKSMLGNKDYIIQTTWIIYPKN
jgi:ubiquinone/menaquinone biosynthesis C-methylase UbiE